MQKKSNFRGFWVIVALAAFVCVISACQNDPPDNPQIPPVLQGTTWADADGNELVFTKTGVTIKAASGQPQSYVVIDTVVDGAETTLYFNEDKSANYIVYNNIINVVLEVKLYSINKTGGWAEKDTGGKPPAITEYWSVNWHLNGGVEGTGEYPTLIEKGGTLAKPSPDPTKPNNTFDGWYTDSGLTQTYDFAGPVTADLNLYAKWEAEEPALEYWSITWHLDGGAKGTGEYPVQIEKDAVIAKPSPDPTKPNNTFDGWYTDSGLTQAYDFAGPVTADLNLYAKWEIKQTYPGTEGLAFELINNGTAYRVRAGTATEVKVGIPAVYNGLPVTEIGSADDNEDSGAFSNTSFISISIPASVTSIGAYAFANCASLTNITIPASVTYVGGLAFMNCVMKIYIEGSMSSWDSSWWHDCPQSSFYFRDSETNGYVKKSPPGW